MSGFVLPLKTMPRGSPPGSARNSALATPTTSNPDPMRRFYSSIRITRSRRQDSVSESSSVSSTDVPTALHDLQEETSLKAKEAAVVTLCNLSAEPPTLSSVIEGGAIPVLVQVLSAPWADPAIVEGAAAALYNVTAEEAGRAAIARAAGIPAMVRLLQDEDVQPQTRQLATAILRLLSTSKDCKKALIRSGGIEVLVQVIRSSDGVEDTLEAKLNAISVMQALSFTDERVAIDWGNSGVLHALIQFMELKSPRPSGAPKALEGSRKSPRSAAVAAAASVLQNLSVYDENKKFIVDSCGVPTMRMLLEEFRGDVAVQRAAASVLFNLAVTPECCQTIVDEQVVPVLVEALREHHPSPELRKFAAGTLQYLSNTEAGADALLRELTAVAKTGSLFVQNLLGDDEPEEISRHIAALARNLCSRPEVLPEFLVSGSIVPGLVEQLRRSYMYDSKEEYLISCLHSLVFHVPLYKVVVADAGGMDVAFKFLAFGNLKAGAMERIAALFQSLTVAPENEARFAPSLPDFLGMAVNDRISMRAREFIMGTIQNVSVNPVNKGVIMQAGGLNAISSILLSKESSPQLLQCVLGVLQNLSNDPGIKPQIAEPALIKAVLTRLVEKDARPVTEKEKEYGMGMLLNVSTVESARVQLAATGVVPLCVRLMNSQVTTLACKQYSAVALHRVSSRQDDLLPSIRRDGGALALKRVLDVLPDAEAQLCARWTLQRLEALSA